MKGWRAILCHCSALPTELRPQLIKSMTYDTLENTKKRLSKDCREFLNNKRKFLPFSCVISPIYRQVAEKQSQDSSPNSFTYSKYDARNSSGFSIANCPTQSGWQSSWMSSRWPLHLNSMMVEPPRPLLIFWDGWNEIFSALFEPSPVKRNLMSSKSSPWKIPKLSFAHSLKSKFFWLLEHLS